MAWVWLKVTSTIAFTTTQRLHRNWSHKISQPVPAPKTKSIRLQQLRTASVILLRENRIAAVETSWTPRKPRQATCCSLAVAGSIHHWRGKSKLIPKFLNRGGKRLKDRSRLQKSLRKPALLKSRWREEITSKVDFTHRWACKRQLISRTKRMKTWNRSSSSASSKMFQSGFLETVQSTRTRLIKSSRDKNRRLFTLLIRWIQ